MPILAELPGDVMAQGMELIRQTRRNSVAHPYAYFAFLVGQMARIASTLTGIPYAVTIHAKDTFHRSANPAWLRRICSNAWRVITISRYNEDYLGAVLAGTGTTVSLRHSILELDRFPCCIP